MQSNQHVLMYQRLGKKSITRTAPKHRVPASKTKILVRQNEDKKIEQTQTSK